MSLTTFNTLLYIWIAIAIVLVPIQLFITAPYGRHTSTKWGPQIDNRSGMDHHGNCLPPPIRWSVSCLGLTQRLLPMWFFFACLYAALPEP